MYDDGTQVVLTANEDSGYPFNSWTGCDTPAGKTCTVMVNANRSVSAVFDACMFEARVMETAAYSTSIQSAYDNAGAGETVQGRSTVIAEDLMIDANKSVAIAGGYNCDYSAITGSTTVNGDMTVTDGVITIQNGTLEVQ